MFNNLRFSDNIVLISYDQRKHKVMPIKLSQATKQVELQIDKMNVKGMRVKGMRNLVTGGKLTT